METLAKIILTVALIGGFSQYANALEAGISAGTVDKIAVYGAYIKKGKYSVDGHMGMEDTSKAMSVAVHREVFNFSDLGLTVGAGLSANQSEVIENNLTKKRTYQGYELELDYNLGKANIRTTINSNGDVKAGVGFSF